MAKCNEEVKRKKMLEILKGWEDELQSNNKEKENIIQNENELEIFNAEVKIEA